MQESKGGSGKERTKRNGKGGPRQAEEGHTRLFLNVGKIDGFYAKEVIGLINRATKGMQVEVGKIDLMKSFTFVEVAAEQAQDVIKSMKHGVTVKGRSVVCDVADKNEEDKESRGKRGNGKRKTENGKHEAGKRKIRTDTHHSPSKNSPQQRHYTKEDWMKFLHPDTSPLKGEMPDFNEEGWARRKPKKK